MSIFGFYDKYKGMSDACEGAYDFENGGDVLLIEESYQDMLEVIEAIHAMDMEEISAAKDINVLEASGDLHEIHERIATFESSIGDKAKAVWEKIKAALAKMKKAFIEFMKSAKMYFSSFIMSASKFVDKYQDEIDKIKSQVSGYKRDMFDYSKIDGFEGDLKGASVEKMIAVDSSAIRNFISGVKTADEFRSKMKDLDKEQERKLNKYRGELAGVGGEVKGEAFTRTIVKTLRGGKTEKRSMAVDIDKMISAIKGSSDAKDVLDKIDGAVTDAFEACSKNVAELEKAFNDAADETKTVKVGDKEVNYKQEFKSLYVQLAQKHLSAISNTKNVLLTALRVYKTMIAERDREYKAAIVGAFGYAKKNKKK